MSIYHGDEEKSQEHRRAEVYQRDSRDTSILPAKRCDTLRADDEVYAYLNNQDNRS